MRLCVFGEHRLGVLAEAGAVVDITGVVDAAVPALDRMSWLIEHWSRLAGTVEAAAAGGVAGRFPRVSPVTLRAPLPRPSKVIAAPVNYHDHQREMGGATGVYAGATIRDITTYAGFLKAPSSIVGPDAAIELPLPGRRVDHEAEIGVVIGRRAASVPRAAAMGYVFGYVPLLDITLRGDEDRSYRKSFDTFTPIGPALVTADEVPDAAAIEFTLTVNGEVRQRASTRDLIYDVPRLIELYSHAMTLEPGDLIATGTPAGVGPLEPGDEVVLDVARMGRLTMSVRARGASCA
jgi:2-keto-4-pentenoate hydratase/2-oxohepta-3-ene-1,7-dioic acid hydratase in catechol pathway